jgi:hypothetical protein
MVLWEWWQHVNCSTNKLLQQITTGVTPTLQLCPTISTAKANAVTADSIS